MNLSLAELRQDIEYYAKELPKRHINAFHTISKKDFEQEIAMLFAKVDYLTPVQVTAEIMRITARIGDGHTGVSLDNFSKAFPIGITIYNERYIITSSNNEYKPLLGSEITHIDGKPIAKVAKTIAPYANGIENEWSWKHRVPRVLVLSELLHGLGITVVKDQASFNLTGAQGEQKTTTISAISDTDFHEISWVQAAKLKPEYLQKPDHAKMKHLWFRQLPDNKTVYVRFDSYPSMKEMKKFSHQLADYIEGNKLSRLTIDLRFNGGGDYFVGLMLARPIVDLDSIDWLNGVFVLTGRKTFSAAMSNAAQYKQMLNAKLIGEPTGADPLGYQELGSFKLPNSKRKIYHSKRVFRFQDVNSEGIQPDVFIARNWELEKEGRDPVIEWLLAH